MICDWAWKNHKTKLGGWVAHSGMCGAVDANAKYLQRSMAKLEQLGMKLEAEDAKDRAYRQMDEYATLPELVSRRGRRFSTGQLR